MTSIIKFISLCLHLFCLKYSLDVNLSNVTPTKTKRTLILCRVIWYIKDVPINNNFHIEPYTYTAMVKYEIT